MATGDGGTGAGDGGTNARDAGAGSADASTGDAQPAICARYVSCATAVQPASAAAILAAYGPAGSCWATTPEVAADCNTACRLGIAQLHDASPSACPICLADAECSGATPACDTAQGACVACTSDVHCPGAACDTSAHACVECLTDQNCTNDSTPVCNTDQHRCVPGCLSDVQCRSPSSPHCALATHSCVECTDSAQCSASAAGPVCFSDFRCGCSGSGQCGTGECSPTSNQCCMATSCEPGFCGLHTDSCNVQHDCGACAAGVCQGGICNASGLACTPGANDCGQQRCMFDRVDQTYVCQKDEEGKQCLLSTDCSFLAGNHLDTYMCTGRGSFGTCQSWCLTNGDCNPGESCMPFGDPISPSRPGFCR